MDQKYVDINYWKEINNDKDTIFDELKGITLLSHNSIKFSHIVNILNKIKKTQNTTIAYISLIRSKGYINSVLKLEPLTNKTIQIIDCVSGYAFKDGKDNDQSLFHKPPNNLEDLKEIINYSIDFYTPDIIVLDSLSQFINFSKINDEELNNLYKFLENLKKESIKFDQITCILLYDNKLGIMKNLPKTMVDQIIKIEVAEEELEINEYYNQTAYQKFKKEFEEQLTRIQ